MPIYIEIAHVPCGKNVQHEITLYKSLEECKYSHNVVQKCNSFVITSIDYIGIDIDIDEDIDVYSVDLLEYDEPESESESQWLVFSFYEINIQTAHVFETLYEARSMFVAETLHITPYNNEIKVSELDDKENMMCTTYIKNNGTYELPDKAKRVVMMRLPKFGMTARI